MEEKNFKTTKKPFDKKTYFKQKYKKNYGSQQEGHGQAFLQKKDFVRQYYKEKKFERRKGGEQIPALRDEDLDRMDEPELDRFSLFSANKPNAPEEATPESTTLSIQQKKPKQSSMKRARLYYHQQIAEKNEKQEARKQRHKDIQAAAVRRKEERLKRNKKLSQFTNKGQPVMRGRIELMLEKLESEIS